MSHQRGDDGFFSSFDRLRSSMPRIERGVQEQLSEGRSHVHLYGRPDPQQTRLSLHFNDVLEQTTGRFPVVLGAYLRVSFVSLRVLTGAESPGSRFPGCRLPARARNACHPLQQPLGR